MWEDDSIMKQMLNVASVIWAAKLERALDANEGMSLTPMDVKVLALVICQIAAEAATAEMKAAMATATPEDFKD